MTKQLIAIALIIGALTLATDTFATKGDSGISNDSISFGSEDKDFDKLFPVTEKLNQILAEISKREIEDGREIPNFIVYPYDADEPHAEPFTLVWAKGRYEKRAELPANEEAILIYDPRRISAGAEEIEGGERVEYQHFVVRYNFNNAPETKSIEAHLESRLEPTDSSVYISRAILKGENTSSRGATTHQRICFPRIAVPKQYQGEDVKMISLQFESALPADSDSEADDDVSEEDESSDSSEKSFFLID